MSSDEQAPELKVGQRWRKPDGTELCIDRIDGDTVHCTLHYPTLPDSAPVDIRMRSEFVSFEPIE